MSANDDLNQVIKHLWSNLGQRSSQNPSKPLTPMNRSTIFATFSKFHLNNSNSPNTKVVQFSWDTTFMLSDISNSKWKCVKNLGQRHQFLFTGTEKDSKLSSVDG
jgi:hypothetical protein